MDKWGTFTELLKDLDMSCKGNVSHKACCRNSAPSSTIVRKKSQAQNLIVYWIEQMLKIVINLLDLTGCHSSCIMKPLLIFKELWSRTIKVKLSTRREIKRMQSLPKVLPHCNFSNSQHFWQLISNQENDEITFNKFIWHCQEV